MDTATDALAGWRVREAPWYEPVGDEVAAFEAAHALALPVMLLGPTGCGKTRFVEHMAWRLGRPLVSVACHEDLSAADLLGRFLLNAEGTRWHDGPLTLAARHGAICYLDELVEARPDVAVLLHALADSRRELPLAATGELLRAHRDFRLVASFNPGYQAEGRTLKPSTRQRFTALRFAWPDAEREARIVAHEAQVARALARRLVDLGARLRALQPAPDADWAFGPDGLGARATEGASTRMLVHAARLIARGRPARAACREAITQPLGDERALQDTMAAVVDACFP